MRTSSICSLSAPSGVVSCDPVIWNQRCAGFILPLLFVVATAGAETINIAFHNGATTLAAMAAGANPATQGAVVDTSAGTWNNVVNNGGVGLSFTGFPLLDAVGGDAGASLSAVSGYSGYNNNGWGANTKDWVMMEGWYGFRSSENLAVTGLPAAFTSSGYKVVIYGDANSARTMNYTLGGVTKTIADSGTFSGDFGPFTVIFTGLTNSSFTVTGNPNAGDSRSAINGLRIIPNPGQPPPPPPGAVGVNFHHSANGALASNDVAGAIPMAGWQNVNIGPFGNFTNRPFADTPLHFADGAASGALLSVTLGSGYVGTSGSGSATPDRVLMSEYISWDPLDGSGPEDPGALVFSGLGPVFTSNGYEVFVSFDSDQANRTFTIRVGADSVIGRDGSTFSGTWVRAGNGNLANYARFRGLTASGFTLEMDSDTGRAAVNAIQIIPTASLPIDVAVDEFKARPSRIQPGGSAALSWKVADATGVVIEPGVGEVTAWTTNGAGSIVVSPTDTTVYTLTATNAQTNFIASATARVVVGPPVPNLVLFLVDDMGWQDTSEPFNYDAAGHPIFSELNQRYRTPAMEALAARGMKFTAAYAAPVCTPTRVALMTGKNTARHRVTNWTTPDGSQPGGSNTADLQPPSAWRRTGIADAETNTLPRLLSQAGYRTIHAGKAHFGSAGSYGHYPENIGFEVNIAGREIGHPASYLGTQNFGSGSHHVTGLEAYHGQDIFLTEALTLEMNQHIARAVHEGVPFFAYMAHYAVHSPWTVDPRFAANYPDLSGSALAFATMIEGMDKSLGDILSQLEMLGVAENTLVVFLSDNGGDFVNTPLRNKKGTLYEGGVRVPMIAAWAKADAANPFQTILPIAPGSRTSDSVLAWDLYPTLLRTAGVEIPAGIDGHDLSGYLRRAPGPHRPQQFAIHFPHHRSNGAASQDPGSIWRDGDWKLIYNYQTGTSELYHLANDLAETTNLAASQPERVMAMSRALARELSRLAALVPERIADGTPVPPTMPSLPSVDMDGDGLPDLVEDPNRNGLRDQGETDPDLEDTDEDRTPDGAEVRTGTDPLDPASKFVASLTLANGAPSILAWPGRSTAFYRVERRSALTDGPWDVLADDLAGQDGTTEFALPIGETGEHSFYRVGLK